MKTVVKIVIPIYREFFDELEEKSFKQCLKVLKDFEIVIVHPEGLNHDFISKIYSQITTKSFSKRYFINIEGYNELLLSSCFYESFLDVNYILIYQLDAFVFKNDLMKWCNRGYDYIGAPWIATPEDTLGMKYFNKLLRVFRSKKKNKREEIFFKVGNGGFSLRKTSSHYEIAKKYQQFIFDFLQEEDKKIYAIEDVFWSLKAPEFEENFKIPDYKESVYFAIDRKPKLALKLTNGELPFGCHGINKPKVIAFWESILQKY